MNSRRNKEPVELTLDLEEGQQSVSFRIGDEKHPVQISYLPSPPQGRRNQTTRNRAGQSYRSYGRPTEHDKSLRLCVPKNVKISNGNDVQIVVEDEKPDLPAEAVREGLGSLARTACRLEEGTKVFVDVLKNHRDFLDASRTRAVKDPTVDKLNTEFKKLKSELEELRKKTSDPRPGDIEELKTRMSDLFETLGRATRNRPEQWRTARSKRRRRGRSLDSFDRRIAGDFDGIQFQIGGRDVKNTLTRLHAIAKENKKLMKQVCRKEMDVIGIQKSYIDKAERLLSEQEGLLKKLYRIIEGRRVISEEDVAPTRAETDVLRVMESMAEKMRVQQDATEALKAAVSLLENRIRLKDAEIDDLLNQRRDVLDNVIQPEAAAGGGMTILTELKRKLPEFKMEIKSAKDRNECLEERLMRKDEQFNFLYNALEDQYKKLDDYVQAMVIGAPMESMNERIVEIREYIRLLLRLAKEPNPEQRQAEMVAAKLMQHVFPEGGGWPQTFADLSRNIQNPQYASTPIRGDQVGFMQTSLDLDQNPVVASPSIRSEQGANARRDSQGFTPSLGTSSRFSPKAPTRGSDLFKPSENMKQFMQRDDVMYRTAASQEPQGGFTPSRLSPAVSLRGTDLFKPSENMKQFMQRDDVMYRTAASQEPQGFTSSQLSPAVPLRGSDLFKPSKNFQRFMQRDDVMYKTAASQEPQGFSPSQLSPTGPMRGSELFKPSKNFQRFMQRDDIMYRTAASRDDSRYQTPTSQYEGVGSPGSDTRMDVTPRSALTTSSNRSQQSTPLEERTLYEASNRSQQPNQSSLYLSNQSQNMTPREESALATSDRFQPLTPRNERSLNTSNRFQPMTPRNESALNASNVFQPMAQGNESALNASNVFQPMAQGNENDVSGAFY